MNRQKRGFTLIEVLIVISIIALLALLGMLNLSALGKSRDARRKNDLKTLQTAFEDYYGDHGEYPTDSALTTCGAGTLSPYVAQVPCDPKTKKPYCYVYDSDSPAQNFRVYASLENSSDPVISKLDCAGSDYCGYEDECSAYGKKFNYGVVSSNVVVKNQNIGGGALGGSSPTPTPSPTLDPLPSTVPGSFACDPNGVCNGYANPAGSGCGISFSSGAACQSYCPTSPVWVRCNN